MASQQPLRQFSTKVASISIARGVSVDLSQAIQQFKLSLCIAPAGYGKTIALQQALAALRPELFNHIIINLTEQQSSPAELDNALQCQLQSASVRASTAELLLVIEQPLVVILNDWHVVENQATAAYLSQLISGANGFIHFLVVSRKKPIFSYNKLLLEGKATIFDDSQFRFTNNEIRELAATIDHVPTGDPDFIKAVDSSTEGWPIAVQFYFQLISQHKLGHDISLLSGADNTLANYLDEEVVSALSEPLVSFAAQLAVLGQFSTGSAAEALNEPEAKSLIHKLQASNFYLSPVDINEDFLRFHPLINEYLLASPWAVAQQQADAICIRAAKWARANGHEINAIEYALRGKDYSFLRPLITQSVQKIARDFGFSQKVVEWCEKIPLENTSLSIETHFWLTWSLTFSCHYAEAATQLKSLESHLLDTPVFSSLERANYSSHLAALKVAFNSFTDQTEGMQTEADAWFNTYGDNGDPFDASLVAASRFVGARLQLDHHRARESISIAKTSIPLAQSPYGEMWVHALDGLCEMEFGSYKVAYDIFSDAYLKCQPSTNEVSPIRSTIALFYAKVCYELGHTEMLEQLLQDGFIHINDHGITESAAAGILVDCRVAEKTGLNSALHALSKAEFIGANHTPRLLFFIRKLRTELYLNSNDLEQALGEAELAGVLLQDDGSISISNVNCPLVGAEKTRLGIMLLYAKGRYKHAAKAIKTLLASPQTSHRPLFMTECLLLQSAILLNSQEKMAACRQFNKALRKSIDHGFYQTLIDFSVYTQPVLEEMLKLRKLGNILPEDHLIERISQQLSIAPKITAQTPKVDVDFSTRELELLTLLQSTLNIQEIADYLFLSKATIKWHLNNIYKKLEVKNRSGAVSYAQKLKLIN